jgi:hypothetical protein
VVKKESVKSFICWRKERRNKTNWGNNLAIYKSVSKVEISFFEWTSLYIVRRRLSFIMQIAEEINLILSIAFTFRIPAHLKFPTLWNDTTPARHKIHLLRYILSLHIAYQEIIMSLQKVTYWLIDISILAIMQKSIQ